MNFLTIQFDRLILNQTQKRGEIFVCDIFDRNFLHRFFFEFSIEKSVEIVGMIGEKLKIDTDYSNTPNGKKHAHRFIHM